jgi:hypothetical protein
MIDPHDQMTLSMFNPPAIVVQAFDEQALKREWDEACGDEQDALERKVEVLRKALKQWPMAPRPGFGAQMNHSPEMRRFVRDVLGMPDQKHTGAMNSNAVRLLKHGAERERETARKRSKRATDIKRAVVELVTKYRLGADPAKCMEALANFYEEQTRGQK